LAGLPTYSFDGHDDYVDVPDGVDLGTDEISLSVWVRHDSVGSSNSDEQDYFVMYDGSALGMRYNTNPDGVQFDVETSSGDYEDLNIGVPPTNDWVHYAVVYDSGELRGYKNGLLKESKTVSGMIDPGRGNRLGEDIFGNGRNMDGSLFDARAYDRALTDSEVYNIYSVFGSNSSHETIYKGSSVDSSPSINFTSVNIPTGSNATLRVLEDSDSDGSVENNDTINLQDGVTDYSASGLSGSGELSLNVSLSNSDLTVGSSVEVPVNVTGES
jgi:hypothetical protein